MVRHSTLQGQVKQSLFTDQQLGTIFVNMDVWSAGVSLQTWAK